MTTITQPKPGTKVRICGDMAERFRGHIATVIDAPDMRSPGIVVRFEPSTFIDFWTDLNYWFGHDEYEVLT